MQKSCACEKCFLKSKILITALIFIFSSGASAFGVDTETEKISETKIGITKTEEALETAMQKSGDVSQNKAEVNSSSRKSPSSKSLATNECTLTDGSSSSCGAVLWHVPGTDDFVGARSDRGQDMDSAIDVPRRAVDLKKPSKAYRACRYIDNVSLASWPRSFFVPFRSAAEWDAFLSAFDANPAKGLPPANTLKLEKCARKTTYTILPSCSSLGIDIQLPYVRAIPATTITAFEAFKCGADNMEGVTKVFTSGVSADAMLTLTSNHDTSFHQSGWNTSSTSSIVGKCGSANGGSFTSAPDKDLCENSTPSAVSGSGPWTWTCTMTGDHSKASVECSTGASASSDTPSCGPAINYVTTSIPTHALCNMECNSDHTVCTDGIASNMHTVSLPQYCAPCEIGAGVVVPSKLQADSQGGAAAWQWTCTNPLSGLFTNCLVAFDNVPFCEIDSHPAGAPITNYVAVLCSPGTPKSISASGDAWTWTCSNNYGLEVACSASSP